MTVPSARPERRETRRKTRRAGRRAEGLLSAVGSLALLATVGAAVGCSDARTSGAGDAAAAGPAGERATSAGADVSPAARPATTPASLRSGQAGAPHSLSDGNAARLVSAGGDAATASKPSPAKDALHWVDDYEKALELAKKHDEFVLVDFYTDWCGWCKKLDRDVFSQESFQQAASGVIAVKVNAEKDRNLARQYGATSYPRLFFLDSEGKILEQIRGYLNLPTFTAKVKSVKAGDTEYARYRDAASDPNNLGGIRQFARFLADTDRSEEAIPFWQQVHDETLQRLFANPNLGGLENYHRESLLELGRAYVNVGLTDVGRQHLDEVATSYPGSSEAAASLVILAELASKDGDHASAKQMLERVLLEAPRSPAARQARAMLPRVQAQVAR